MISHSTKGIFENTSNLLKPLWKSEVRGMATLQTIATRLKSVRSIQKITQSMKMVSAAKFGRAEKELKQTRPFGEGSTKLYDVLEVAPPEDCKNELLIAITSDRGLCGAVHGSVNRVVRGKLQNNTGNVKVACIGEKSRATIQRYAPNNILFTVKEIGRLPPVFKDAANVATTVLESQFEYDAGYIVYNKFINATAYQTVEMPIYTLKDIETAPKIVLYDSLDADVIQSYLEYSLASLIYYALKENACSEQSARMAAMDSSSRNAGEMIQKLQLTFNRTRQAVITRELIEIISGASALE